MGFTSFAAERTRDWKLRQLAPVEWTTSFLGKRCRSIKSPRDCFLPMTACKSSTSAATSFPECCGGTPIFHWRRTIPVLGPISEILNHIVPGMGYSIAREANTKFKINDGIIHTDDFNVSGQLFSVIGHGDVHFLDDKIDLDVRISAKGPGVVLTPVYKLFEYKAEGSLKKPDWHPKIF